NLRGQEAKVQKVSPLELSACSCRRLIFDMAFARGSDPAPCRTGVNVRNWIVNTRSGNYAVRQLHSRSRQMPMWRTRSREVVQRILSSTGDVRVTFRSCLGPG